MAIATLLTNDWDADADALCLNGVSATSAEGGTAVIVDWWEWVTYMPPPGFTNTDTFTYTISDGYAEAVTGTVTVTVPTEPDVPVRLTLSPLGAGAYLLKGEGFSNRTYRVESATNLSDTNWQTLGAATADALGEFQFTNSSSAPQRFYRTIYP